MLNTKLNSYLLMATGFLLTKEFKGQVVYTDIDPDKTLEVGENYLVDMDFDGDYDFIVSNFSGSTFNGVVIKGVLPDNQVVGYLGFAESQSFFMASQFEAYSILISRTIGPSLNWYNSGNEFISFTSDSLEIGLWGSDEYGAVGVRFMQVGNLYYGWIRLSLDFDPLKIHLQDYAFNATPNMPFEPVGIDNNESNNAPNVYYADGSIQIDQLQNQNNCVIKILNMSGEMVYNDQSKNKTKTISTHNFTPGIYLIRVEIDNSYFHFTLPIF